MTAITATRTNSVIVTMLGLFVVLGCGRLGMENVGELSTDFNTCLSSRQYQIIGAVVVELCEQYQTTAATLRSTTTSKDEVMICRDEFAHEFIADRFGIRLEEFCHLVSQRPIVVSSVDIGPIALIGAGGLCDDKVVNLVISEPVFARDGRAFVYAIASSGPQRGGDVFLSLAFKDRAWVVEKSTVLGIQ